MRKSAVYCSSISYLFTIVFSFVFNQSVVNSAEVNKSKQTEAVYNALVAYQEVVSTTSLDKEENIAFIKADHFFSWLMPSAIANESKKKVCLFLGATFLIEERIPCNLNTYKTYQATQFKNANNYCFKADSTRDTSKIACSMPQYATFADNASAPTAVCVDPKLIMGTVQRNGKTFTVPKYKNTICQKAWDKACKQSDGSNTCLQKMADFLTKWDETNAQEMYTSFKDSYKNLKELACKDKKEISRSCSILTKQMEGLASLLKDGEEWKNKPAAPTKQLITAQTDENLSYSVHDIELKSGIDTKKCCEVSADMNVNGNSLPLLCDGKIITIENVNKARFYSAKVDLFDDRNQYVEKKDAELLDFEFNDENTNNTGDVIQYLLTRKSYKIKGKGLATKKPYNVKDREYLVLNDQMQKQFTKFTKENSKLGFKDLEGVRFTGPVCFDVTTVEAKNADKDSVELLGGCRYRSSNLIKSALGNVCSELKAKTKPICWAQVICASSGAEKFTVSEAFCGAGDNTCPKDARDCALDFISNNGGTIKKLDNFKFIDPSKKSSEEAN